MLNLQISYAITNFRKVTAKRFSASIGFLRVPFTYL